MYTGELEDLENIEDIWSIYHVAHLYNNKGDDQILIIIIKKSFFLQNLCLYHYGCSDRKSSKELSLF